MEQTKKILKTVAILLLWLTVWQIAAMLLNQEILIPTPLSTLKSLIELSRTTEFYLSVLFSLLRIISGYILGVLAGILGALLSHKSKLFNAVFSPIIKIIKAVPVASFIILALVWFHAATLPVFITFLMVMPMIWSTVQDALDNTDKKFIELAKVYRLSSLKTLIHIKMQFVISPLISTALTALGFAWKSGIAAEVICRPHNSLGNMLQEAKLYISTPDVFALTTIVALLSIILEMFIKKALRRYCND